MRIILLSLLAIIFITSCYYENEEFLFPELPGECDTTEVSFSTEVKPIIEDNCIICHSNKDAASLGGNIMLEDFSDVSAQSSMILNSINHEPGSSPMPQGGAKLINCELMIIEAWTIQGKNEN